MSWRRTGRVSRMCCISNLFRVCAKKGEPFRGARPGYFCLRNTSSSLSTLSIGLSSVISCWLRFTTPMIPSLTGIILPWVDQLHPFLYPSNPALCRRQVFGSHLGPPHEPTWVLPMSLDLYWQHELQEWCISDWKYTPAPSFERASQCPPAGHKQGLLLFLGDRLG